MASDLAVVLRQPHDRGRGRLRRRPRRPPGSALAVEHLVALGHRPHRPPRRVRGDSHRPAALAWLRRGDGGRTASTGDREPDRAGPRRSPSQRPARRAARELLAAEPQPRPAIVAGNDLLALGAYTALAEAGLRLPERRVGDRLQRHAVRRPLRAAADDRPHPARPDRRARGRAPAGADRGPRRHAADAAVRADPQGAGLDGGATRVPGVHGRSVQVRLRLADPGQLARRPCGSGCARPPSDPRPGSA